MRYGEIVASSYASRLRCVVFSCIFITMHLFHTYEDVTSICYACTTHCSHTRILSCGFISSARSKWWTLCTLYLENVRWYAHCRMVRVILPACLLPFYHIDTITVCCFCVWSCSSSSILYKSLLHTTHMYVDMYLYIANETLINIPCPRSITTC